MTEAPPTDRPRLLALSTSYPLRADSYSGIFVHNLYAAMHEHWHVDVVCPADTGESLVALDNVNILAARYAARPWQILGGAGGILPSMRRNPFALLLLPLLLASLFTHGFSRAREAALIHGNWTVCGLLAVVLGRMANKPVVVTVRGSDVQKASTGFVFAWLLETVVSHADSIVCVSEPMRTDLMAQFPAQAEKIACCPNGVSDAFFSIERTPRVEVEPIRLVAVGSLLPVKGFDILLSALAALKGCQAFQLTIIGEGPERLNLQTQIDALDLSGCVHLEGAVSPNQMPQRLAQADLFVLSSRSEGRPNAVVEAVASALPVLSADLPGVRGVVEAGANGWLFKPGDTKAFENTLKNAFAEHANWQAMGLVGREQLRAYGTWQTTAKKYEQIFDAAIKAQRR